MCRSSSSLLLHCILFFTFISLLKCDVPFLKDTTCINGGWTIPKDGNLSFVPIHNNSTTQFFTDATTSYLHLPELLSFYQTITVQGYYRFPGRYAFLGEMQFLLGRVKFARKVAPFARKTQIFLTQKLFLVKGAILQEKRSSSDPRWGGGDVYLLAKSHTMFHIDVNMGENQTFYRREPEIEVDSNLLSTRGGVEIWEKSEKFTNNVKPGQDGSVSIRLTPNGYEVFINNKYLTTHKPSSPHMDIDGLNINFFWNMAEAHISGREFKIPFEVGFPGGHLKMNDRVIIAGYSRGPDGFIFDFLNNASNVAMHFNPRFYQNAVVRNSAIDGEFNHKQEELDGGFPFVKGDIFDVVIALEPSAIEFYVNNEKFATFKHRTLNPATDYVSLRVHGEVVITGLEICTS